MTHSFRETMKDLKFKEKLSGLGGVDSIICESRKEDWKTIDKIPESFPITHSAESSIDLYEQLIHIGDGEIKKKQGDYQNRNGLTQKPLHSFDQLSICILISYLNVLSWFFKVFYHCNQSYKCWIEK